MGGRVNAAASLSSAVGPNWPTGVTPRAGVPGNLRGVAICVSCSEPPCKPFPSLPLCEPCGFGTSSSASVLLSTERTRVLCPHSGSFLRPTRDVAPCVGLRRVGSAQLSLGRTVEPRKEEEGRWEREFGGRNTSPGDPTKWNTPRPPRRQKPGNGAFSVPGKVMSCGNHQQKNGKTTLYGWNTGGQTTGVASQRPVPQDTRVSRRIPSLHFCLGV